MRHLFLILVTLITALSAQAQLEEKKDNPTNDNKIDFAPIPYVSYNRTYDFIFGAVPMIMYKLNARDTISPSSLSGAIGIYTTNKSWFSAVFSKFYLNEDKWRITVGAGLGTMNSQFLQSGAMHQFINFQTGADFFKLEVKRRLLEDIYGGVNYLYTNFNNEYDFETPVEEEVELQGLGLVFIWDKRDDVYYPRSGHKLLSTFTAYPKFMGNTEVSNQLTLQYNWYIPKRDNKDVWSFRAYSGFGLGDVAFNNLLVFGGTDLRGYSQGEYRGKQLLAAQTEYRYQLGKKMGLVAFAGLGSVFGSNVESNDGTVLPSIGIGYRYLAFSKQKMNVGLDLAVGKDDWGVYFRIGEAF